MEKSKNIRYLIYSIMIILIMGLMFLIPNQTRAHDTSQAHSILDSIKNSHSQYNGTIPIWFQTLQQRHDLYCMGHDDLFQGLSQYRNSLYLRINGNTASGHVQQTNEDVTITDRLNGMFAYIIAADGENGGYGYAPDSETDQRAWSASQIALYKFIDEWIGDPTDNIIQIGERFNVGDWHGKYNNRIDADAQGNPNLQRANQILKEAGEYADSIGNSTGSSEVVANDTTNKDNIKVEYFTENEVSYMKVGPFNWTFTGKLNSVTLTGNNGIQPEIRIYKADGKTQTDASGIESGKNFYVAFRTDTGITSISKLEGKGQNAASGIINAEIWFLENINADGQKIILVDYGTDEPKDFTITTENILLPIDFTIVKVDEDDNTIKLSGVKFKFYNVVLGKYLQQSGESFVFVDTIEEATEYETDSEGRIELKNVPVGIYRAYETENPNRNYDVLEDPVEFTPTDNAEIMITNKQKYISFIIEKVDLEDNTIKIPGVGFKFYNVDEGKFLYENSEGEYELVDTIEEATEYITDENGRIDLDYVPIGTYLAYETKIPDRRYEVSEEPVQFTPEDNKVIVITNEVQNISFSIVKVDEYDTDKKLSGVGFKFYSVRKEKFIKTTDTEYEYEFVDTIEEATEFITDENGKIQLDYVPKGEYIAYETRNPNYGYVVDSSEGIQVVPEEGAEVTLTNPPEYVKLSGMVWLDKQSEKMSVRNDLYRLDDNDDQDVLMEGIKVTLKDKRTGEPVTDRIEGLAEDQVIVNPTYTDAEGNYHFDYVSADDLENYYVEFEYDGMIYQNVTPNLENVEKGSKASEPDRQTFNNNYSTIERGNAELQASAKDSQGNEHGRVNYKVQEQSELKRILEKESTESCEIIATTDAAGYVIDLETRDENNEIKYINLGIYERLQTDLSIRSEIAKVTAEINGYGHVYNYMVGENALGNQSIEDWNLGIRTYDGRYKNAYERPIYKADAEYTNASDPSKELRMTMTYEISIINESQLYSKINQVVSYFNNKYTVNAIGSKVNEQGVVEGTTLSAGDYTVESYNDSFNRLTINTGALNEIINPSTVAAGEGEQKVTQQKVYVQFNLSRGAIVDMLNEGDTKEKTLDFVSEIASFTSYLDENGTLYAAYDLDSVPNNATLNNESTYEDDTEKASPIALTIAEPRQVTGTVFEDNQIANDQNTAEGNGMFDEGSETRLNGVTVELIDVTTGNLTSYVNDEGETVTPTIEMTDGNYTITGFIPGEYQVRFTWGNGTTRVDSSLGYDGGTEEITVENYKSTVMDYNTYNSETENRKYYMDDGIMNGRSQAIDNTETRAEIDQALQNYNYASDSSIETMTASTLPMTYSIEYDTDDLTNVVLEGNNIRFLRDNMNFGIIRRAKPGLELEKTVSNFKLTLPTGQVLIDATIDENGNLSGETNYLSYIGDPTDPSSAVIRAELDENLIQGSQLEVTYTLRATNVGQADFLSSDYGYYRFGETYYNAVGQEQKEQDIITSSPALIVDYLDESLQYSESNQINIDNEWQLVQLDANASEDENRNQLDIQVLENVLTHKYTDSEGNEVDLGNYTIYKTAHLANSNLKPLYSRNSAGESATVQMVATQNLSSGTDAGTINQAEIILLTKPGGGEPSHTPGNYIPDPNNPDSIPGKEIDDSPSPEVVVIPSTGGNMNYVLPITVGVVACIILAGGVFLIKTKVLKKKDE